jgi:hypothetical protein
MIAIDGNDEGRNDLLNSITSRSTLWIYVQCQSMQDAKVARAILSAAKHDIDKRARFI